MNEPPESGVWGRVCGGGGGGDWHDHFLRSRVLRVSHTQTSAGTYKSYDFRIETTACTHIQIYIHTYILVMTYILHNIVHSIVHSI